ncbi:phosphoribosyltransferase family protein [Arthrobacter sp. UYCu712]|uniref:ComF family protein n=1 Tax=Arthrobacter sp. UYCu712 TaxID=3156340 RepID=UPI003399EBC6
MGRHKERTGGKGRRRAADPDLVSPEPPAARHRDDYPAGPLRLADRAAAAAAELLALAVPVDCVCCGTEDLALCGTCARQIRLLTGNPFRAEAQAPALMDMDGTVLLPVVAAGVYRGELAQAVLSFKRHGQAQLGDVLAKALAGAVSAATGDPAGLWLVPVPTSNGAYRKRGFSPVHLLLKRSCSYRASGAAEGSGPLVVDALRKAGPLAGARRGGDGNGSVALRRPAGGQKGLGRGARSRRVRGSMRTRGGLWPPEPRGRACIIVDDVLTTGATLAEAARALRQAGGVVLGAVVLAATRPPVASDFGAADRMVAGETGGRGKNKPKKDE